MMHLIEKVKRTIYSILAVSPALFVASFLMVTCIAFSLMMIPTNILPIKVIDLVEIIIVVLLVVYGIRVSKITNQRLCKYSYFIILLVSCCIFFFFKLIVLIQPGLLILYGVILEEKLVPIKKYFSRNVHNFAFLNFWDTIFISLLALLNSYIENVSKQDNSKIMGLLDNNAIPLTLGFFAVLIVPPIIRGYLSIYIYKKQNGVNLPQNRVLWNSYFWITVAAILTSTSSLLVLLQGKPGDLFAILVVICIYMATTVLFWTPVDEKISRGGDGKNETILGYVLLAILVAMLVLLDQIESDLISILTWFLPMLLPVFIGEIHFQKNGNDSENFEPTKKMKRHLYWLQILSFNTLVVMNIISSLNTKKYIQDNIILEENTLKNDIGKIINHLTLESTESSIMLGILSSFSLVVISAIIASILSKRMIRLLEKYYLDSNRGYFKRVVEEENSDDAVDD